MFQPHPRHGQLCRPPRRVPNHDHRVSLPQDAPTTSPRTQYKDDDPPTMRCTARLTSNSIMQEAMLSCVDMYKPKYVLSADLGILNFAATVPTGTTYTVTPQQMLVHRIPMTWFYEMANSVIGENGELLKYCHLIAHNTTRTARKHSYGNEIGRLAQGMPGRNTGTNTEEPGPAGQSQGRDLRAHHMSRPTCKNRRAEQDEVSGRRRQSALPGRRQHSHRRPTHRQTPPQ